MVLGPTEPTNRIEISSGSPAARYLPEYLSIDHPIAQALERIRANPHPDGETITTVHMPPVTVHYYDDGQYKIGYGLSYLSAEDIYIISVYSITPSSPDE